MKTRILWSLSILALFVAAACAADVTGAWKYETKMGERTIAGTFNFKADGSKLTGTAVGQRGETPIQDGKIDGDNISFAVVRNFNGNEMKIQYKGKVEGDTMKLSVSMGERNFDIVAKKQ